MEERPAACLYFERQVAALCGVHTINTLLQGPYINEIDLAQIAQELDALERAFMAESGLDSEEYQRFIAEGSGNVDIDGMFSIQVLSKALEVWGLAVIPLSHPEVRRAVDEPEVENAFICNCREHWFTVRVVNGEWWNFNSLLPAPAPLSTFYLVAFLGTLREQGYTIFVVRGEVPAGLLSTVPDLCPHGRYFTPEQARSVTRSAEETRAAGYRKATMQGLWEQASEQGTTLTLRPSASTVSGDEELQQAIAASLQQGAGAGPSPSSSTGAPAAAPQVVPAPTAEAGPSSSFGPQPGPSTSAGPPPAPASSQPAAAAAPTASPAASSDKGKQPLLPPQQQPAASEGSVGAAQVSRPGSAGSGVSGGAAHTASPQRRPNTPPNAVVQLAIRMPAGDRLVRKMRLSDKVSDVYYLLTASCKDRTNYDLLRQFPKVVLPDDATTLSEAGILDKETLTFQRKPEPEQPAPLPGKK